MHDLGKDILASLTRQGYLPGSDPYEICSTAFNYLGRPYSRTEELVRETVDCSTLVSQSHWEGAFIGIPFIAESQRTAPSGVPIELGQCLPGDVFVRFDSIHASPDKTYNHVGLYVGTDLTGKAWIFESNSAQGVVFTPVDEFPPHGGIKRYWLNASPDDSPLGDIRALAKRTPKLGRLGARQYLNSSRERPVHKGLDIYAPEGAPAYASTSGYARIIKSETEDACGIQLTSDEIEGLSFTYLHVAPSHGIQDKRLAAGTPIGHLTRPSGKSDLAHHANTATSNCHLHIEVESAAKRIAGLSCHVSVGASNYFNILYLCRVANIILPLQAN